MQQDIIKQQIMSKPKNKKEKGKATPFSYQSKWLRLSGDGNNSELIKLVKLDAVFGIVLRFIWPIVAVIALVYTDFGQYLLIVKAMESLKSIITKGK